MPYISTMLMETNGVTIPCDKASHSGSFSLFMTNKCNKPWVRKKQNQEQNRKDMEGTA